MLSRRPGPGSRFVLAILSMLVLASCGPNYQSENEAIADAILANEEVITVIGKDSSTYCESDSCWLGDDGRIEIYNVQILADFETVVKAFYAAYPGYEIFSDECVTEECDGRYTVSVDRDDVQVFLRYDDNATGELVVDAHAPVSTG